MNVSTSVVLFREKLWSTFIVLIASSGQTCSFWRVWPAHQHAGGCRPQQPPVGCAVGSVWPLRRRGGVVALARRDRRLSVPPSFPRSVREQAFYAVLELPAAVLACCRDVLDLGVLPPDAIFARPYRCPASGFGRYSSVGKYPWTEASAILLEECKYPRICAKPPSSTP